MTNFRKLGFLKSAQGQGLCLDNHTDYVSYMFLPLTVLLEIIYLPCNTAATHEVRLCSISHLSFPPQGCPGHLSALDLPCQCRVGNWSPATTASFCQGGQSFFQSLRNKNKNKKNNYIQLMRKF